MNGESRRWDGAEWGGVWGAMSPLQPTKGPGERRELPSGVRTDHRPKTDFGVFWRPQNAPFCTYMTKIWGKQFALTSPLLQIPGEGTCSLRPPVIYADAQRCTNVIQVSTRRGLYLQSTLQRLISINGFVSVASIRSAPQNSLSYILIVIIITMIMMMMMMMTVSCSDHDARTSSSNLINVIEFSILLLLLLGYY